MKTIYSILCLMLFVGISAQVAIEKDMVTGPNTLLDFASNGNKGIVLPKTNGAAGVGGTITFDRTDKMVKLIYNNGVSVPMNTNTGDFNDANYDFSGTEVGESVIIGAKTATGGADGILILEATDKALILPKVANPSLNIKSPEAGTICYDTVTKAIAVFNGTEWSFWY